MARCELFTEGDVLELVVTLSRRNLLGLLHKLEQPGSARAIRVGDVYLDGQPVAFPVLIRCEDDGEHYAGRAEPPGDMHPDTERFIRRSTTTDDA